MISPHGRGVGALANARPWGDLPALGNFAVVNPQGQGRRLTFDSWGDPGQIADLARMPLFLHKALPWLEIERRRIYAVGGSMGGQETLLLLARDPHLLAGAIAFDAVVNLAFQYRSFPRIPCADKCRRVFEHGYGLHLQKLARQEVGGSPASDPRGYELRSPLDVARRIAFSGVPLELWWSRADLVVRDQQAEQSGRLFRAITRINPEAPVEAFVGSWIHTHEMRASTRLPFALANLDLLPEHFEIRPHHLH